MPTRDSTSFLGGRERRRVRQANLLNRLSAALRELELNGFEDEANQHRQIINAVTEKIRRSQP